MVLVEGGTFLQGSNEQPFAQNERVHPTTLSTFLISRTELTQEQWKKVHSTNPSRFPGNSRPVDSVSWLDAVKFCNALSQAENLTPAYTISGASVTWDPRADGYRLPTEAEWEYAARGGAAGTSPDTPLSKSYFSGSHDPDEVAWFDRNSGKTSKSVGTKAANELGLFDMSGNVWEWCWDWYGEYPSSEVENPSGPSVSTGQRVLRGGAWFTPLQLLRVTYRYWNVPYFKANSVGFRLARNAPPPASRD